jgi:hypothetical protein
LQPRGETREALLDRTLALTFGRGQLVGIAPTHEGEILRQHGQHCAARRRLLQQALGHIEIDRNLVHRAHLHSRNDY